MMNAIKINKRWIVVTLTIAVAAGGSNLASAATISIEGDVGSDLQPIGASGQLEIIVDNSEAETTFVNGGLSIALESSVPGVIQFTDADVMNPEIPIAGDRWSGVSVEDLTPDSIGQLTAASVNSPGLNPAAADAGDHRFLFATVNYNVVGAGATDLSLSASDKPDPLFSEGVDVSSQTLFLGAEVSAVPEPSSVIMASLSFIGLGIGLRRRFV